MHVSAGNPVPALAACASFARRSRRLGAGDAGRRVVVTSGPSERDAAARVIDAGPRAPAAGRSRDRVLACGEFSLAELRALVDRAALLHRRRQRAAARRRDEPRADRRAVRSDAARALGAVARRSAWPAEAVEIDGLPCRPCDQRVCAPGDFRCLTRIQPAAGHRRRRARARSAQAGTDVRRHLHGQCRRAAAPLN